MSARIPKDVIISIREQIFRILDEVQYLSQDRKENGKVMDRLVADPDIGGRIAEYVGKPRIKTYIKDAVINRYAKERTRPPMDLTSILEDEYGAKYLPLVISKGRNDVCVFRSESGGLAVVCCGRLIKWESALRKLIEFLGQKSEKLRILSSRQPDMLLILMSGGKVIPDSDRTLLEKNLAIVNVHTRIL